MGKRIYPFKTDFGGYGTNLWKDKIQRSIEIHYITHVYTDCFRTYNGLHTGFIPAYAVFKGLFPCLGQEKKKKKKRVKSLNFGNLAYKWWFHSCSLLPSGLQTCLVDVAAWEPWGLGNFLMGSPGGTQNITKLPPLCVHKVKSDPGRSRAEGVVLFSECFPAQL